METRSWFEPAVSTATPLYTPVAPPLTGHTRTTLNGAENPRPRRPGGLSRSYATIEPTLQDFLWPERIPLGDVTLVGGDGGIGKGRLLADLAARVSRGDDMLDNSPGLGAPGNVLMVTPEDDPSYSMAWRLGAAHAALDMVHDMTEVQGREFQLPGDVPLLREEMLRLGDVKLVIIDPLSQVSEKSLQANATVRKYVWGPLRQLARDTGAAIVVMCHTVKSGQFQGSAGLTQAARVVLKVTRDKADPRVRVLSIFKGNDVDDSLPDVCYTLTGSRPNVVVEYVDRAFEEQLEGLSDGERRALMVVRTRAQSGQHTDAQKLAEMTRTTATAARVTLHRMAKKGLIERLERGWYTMPSLKQAAG